MGLDPAADGHTIRPAATVVMLRDGDDGVEVLLVRRSSRAPFMPDAMVFPGGRVDAPDATVPILAHARWNREAARHPHDADAPPVAAWYVAALRECIEEVGLLPLPRADEELSVMTVGSASRQAIERGEMSLPQLLEAPAVDVTALVYVARWITPAFESRRYDTRFFVAHVPDLAEACADERETHHAAWWRPADVLAAATDDALVLAPPTWHMLQRLQPFETAEEVMQWAATTRPAAVHPTIDQVGARIRLGLTVDPFDESGPPDSIAWEVRGGGRFGIWA